MGWLKKALDKADKVVFGETSDAHSATKDVTEALKREAEKREGDKK